ncbi:MAG: MarR family transcriptional regulator [Clostridiales bacterium]|jgi:DNA-binding MarR family transcriptional regulator|nr:MarR family transcriptional regulator [Clostridiales bacterium]
MTCVRMEDVHASPGGQLLQAFQEVRRASSGFRPIGDLRQSEFYMVHAIFFGLMRQTEDLKEGQLPPPGVTVSYLSRATHSSMPAVSQLLRGLEEKGIVERAPAKSDRRKVYVRLTEQGQKTVEEAGHAFFDLLDAVVDRMGKEDTQKLIRLLHKATGIIHAVKDEYHDGKLPKHTENSFKERTEPDE